MGSVAGHEGSREERSLSRGAGRVPPWCSPGPRSPFAQPRAPLSFVDELEGLAPGECLCELPGGVWRDDRRDVWNTHEAVRQVGGDATPRCADGSTFARARARLPSPPARVPPPVDGNAPPRAQPRSSAGTRTRGPAVGSAHRRAGARVPPVNIAVVGRPRQGRAQRCRWDRGSWWMTGLSWVEPGRTTRRL